MSELDFVINGEKLEKYRGNKRRVIIPDGITEIGDYAFFQRDVFEIVIPNSVVHIGKYAFENCILLMNIIIPPGVKSIGECAFSGCKSLKHIDIPSSVTSIKQHAFRHCAKLENVRIFGNVDRIENAVFQGCSNLTNVELPESIKAIGDSAFENCESLTDIIIPPGVKSIGESAFTNCKSLVELRIPESVERVKNWAFINCYGLKKVSISNDIQKLERGIFANCEKLKSINIPDSVTCIDVNAIPKSCGLKICISDHHPVFKFENGILYDTLKKSVLYCSADTEDVIFPVGVACIGSCAFSKCKRLKKITVPDTVVTIEREAFKNCSALEAVSLPESITCIDVSVFENCKAIKSIDIPKSVTSVFSCAFRECIGLKSISIPCNVEKLACDAFFACIGLEDFYNHGKCSAVEAIVHTHSNIVRGFLPKEPFKKMSTAQKEIASICYLSSSDMYSEKEKAVYNDYIKKRNAHLLKAFIEKRLLTPIVNLLALKIVTPATLEKAIDMAQDPEIRAILLDYQNENVDIEKEVVKKIRRMEREFMHVETEAERSRKQWIVKRLGNGEGTVKYIGDEKNVTVPEKIGKTTVVGLSEKAFFKSEVETVTLPRTLKTIGKFAFKYCKALKKICVSEEGTEPEGNDGMIGKEAFYGCAVLEAVRIPSCIKVIDQGAFSYCKSLKEAVLPDGIKSISDRAFFACVSITELFVPDGVESIGEEAFCVCKNLMNVSLPEGIKIIKQKAFASCHKLLLLNIPESIATVEKHAFKDSEKLKLYVPESVEYTVKRSECGCKNIELVFF